MIEVNQSRSFQKILFVFFLFIGILLMARIGYTGQLHFIFLVWNIFLAWIPFSVSHLFKNLHIKIWWKQALLFGCWLAFFPNALYIVTDLIHLEKESSFPKWFDAVLLFSSSVVGLMMAFVSLYRTEKYLGQLFKQQTVKLLVVMLLFLGSFGVYLGRFLRWNSWDIINNPLQLFISILHLIISPIDHYQTWGITFILTALFYLLYSAIKKLPGYISQAI